MWGIVLHAWIATWALVTFTIGDKWIDEWKGWFKDNNGNHVLWTVPFVLRFWICDNYLHVPWSLIEPGYDPWKGTVVNVCRKQLLMRSCLFCFFFSKVCQNYLGKHYNYNSLHMQEHAEVKFSSKYYISSIHYNNYIYYILFIITRIKHISSTLKLAIYDTYIAKVHTLNYANVINLTFLLFSHAWLQANTKATTISNFMHKLKFSSHALYLLG